MNIFSQFDLVEIKPSEDVLQRFYHKKGVITGVFSDHNLYRVKVEFSEGYEDGVFFGSELMKFESR